MIIKKIFVRWFFIFSVIFVLYGCNAENIFQSTKGDIVSIQISPVQTTFGSHEVQVAKGNSLALTAIATFEDQSTEDVTKLVNWITRDAFVAGVDMGIVSALSPGATSISASYGGIESNIVDVVITSPELTSIQLTPPVASSPKGMHQEFKALGIYSDGTSALLNENASVEWRLSDSAIASVTKGKARALKTGSTEIFAELDGIKSNVVTFSSTDSVVTSIQIQPRVVDLALGSSVSYTATAIYSDGSSRDVTDDAVWSSSDSDIVSVEKNKVTANGKGLAVISASINGIKSSINISVTDAVLTSIQVSPALQSIPKGSTFQLIAIGFYSDGSNRVLTDDVSWGSSETSVATVIDGTVNTVRMGDTIITAKLNGVSSNEVELTVTSAVVMSLQITPAVNNLAKGTTSQYKAIAFYSDGTTGDISKDITWKSSNTDIATVISGLATGVSEGKVFITGQFDGITSNKASLVVTDAKLASIQVTPAKVSVAKGFDSRYLAIGIYTDKTSKTITEQVLWKSSDTNVAKMNGSLATGLNEGETTITATLGDVISNDSILTVTAKELVSIQATPTIKSIPQGSNQEYVATARYSDSSTADITSLVTWRSSEVRVATIVNGLASGVAEGETTITATFGGVQSNDAMLTVTSAELVSIQVTPVDKSIPKGTNQKYIATGTYTDNSTKDITTNVSWISSDTDIATIVNGLASGVAEGETTITATFGGVQSNDATLIVTSAELVSIQISPVNKSIPKGEDLEYLAIATYSDRSTKDVTASVVWISSDTSVATIVDGTAVGFKEGETKITASQGLITSNQATLTVTSAELVSIQVTPADKSIAKGLTQKYKALGRYTDNTSKDITANVSWLSSDANVATIVRGAATSIKEGETKITASQGEITSNQAKLTVTSAELLSIQVTPAIQTIAKGQNAFYKADGRYTDGTVEDISKEVSWASTDVNVATIVLQGNSAIATGLMKGDTVISASLEGIISNQAGLTVTDAITVSLQITPVRSSVPLGIDQQYEAIVTYSDATTADVTRQVSWNSSDLNVATITPAGKARTITRGTTEIEATFNGVTSNSSELVVGDSVLVSILLTPDSAVHAVGDGRQYGAIAEYSDGTSLPVMEQVDWFIDDASIATISDSGLLRAVSPGTTKIRVTMGSIISNESVITVTPAVVRFVEISPITESVAKGNRVQYQAQARMSTGMVTDVTDRVSWVSSNTTVATITWGGGAQGVTEGSVKISATLDGKDSNQADLTVTGAVISSIEITPQDASIIIGNTQQYAATAVYSDGSRVDATSNVNWVSSSVAATISTNGLATGVIQNRVTITANSNGVRSNRATLNVVRASLLSIEIEPKSASIPKGTTQQYLATGIYDNSARVDITTQVTWTRGDSTVAAVSLTGLATGRNAGTTTIGAILNGVTSLDSDLIVTDAIVSSLKVTPESYSMDKGQKKQYTATGLYTDGAEVDLTKEVIWHIEKPTIASVNITGEVEGVDYGSTIIRATKGEERSNNATLTITDGRQLPIFEHYPWQWFPPQEYAWYVDRLGITPDGAFVENGEKGPDGMVVGLFTLEKANAVCNAITKPNTERLFRWKVAPLEASQHLMTFNSNMYKKQGWAVGQYVWSPVPEPREGKYMAISFEIRHIGSLDYPSELNYVACVRDFRATGDILVL